MAEHMNGHAAAGKDLGFGFVDAEDGVGIVRQRQFFGNQGARFRLAIRVCRRNFARAICRAAASASES